MKRGERGRREASERVYAFQIHAIHIIYIYLGEEIHFEIQIQRKRGGRMKQYM